MATEVVMDEADEEVGVLAVIVLVREASTADAGAG